MTDRMNVRIYSGCLVHTFTNKLEIEPEEVHNALKKSKIKST